MRGVAAALLLAAGMAGQARGGGSPAARAVMAPVRYLGARGQDLLDVFEVNVGAGRGLKLDVKYGVNFLGLSDIKAWRAGTIDRRAGVWRELDSEIGLFPLSLLAWPVHYAARACGCDTLAADARFVARAGSVGVQHLDRKELNGEPEFFEKDTVEGWRHTRWRDCFPIGAEIHATVGVRLMMRPLQLVDFLVGFVGLDMDPQLAKGP
jgi:hypothetical protein